MVLKTAVHELNNLVLHVEEDSKKAGTWYPPAELEMLVGTIGKRKINDRDQMELLDKYLKQIMMSGREIKKT